MILVDFWQIAISIAPTLHTYSSNLVQIFQQVETVGDKYMAVSGLPDEVDNHAACIARLALGEKFLHLTKHIFKFSFSH